MGDEGSVERDTSDESRRRRCSGRVGREMRGDGIDFSFLGRESEVGCRFGLWKWAECFLSNSWSIQTRQPKKVIPIRPNSRDPNRPLLNLMGDSKCHL
uniref:Uncharacterized protein n=1 Tax=Arundo donax TaxID=35708 RepID=A0A0A9AC32_ARUDO